MPLLNNGPLMHGVYKLPINIHKKLVEVRKGVFQTRTFSYDNLSERRTKMQLSNILNMISKKGGGTVIGVFCRGLGNVSKSNRTPLRRTVLWKRNASVHVNTVKGTKYLSPRGGIAKYKTLRHLQSRKPYLNAIKNSEVIRPIPRASGSGARMRYWGLLKKL